MEELKVHEELGVIKGQLVALPAIIAQAIEPRLDKQKEEIINEVEKRIMHCREIQYPKMAALEKAGASTQEELSELKTKQARVGIAIGVLSLAFVGALGGGLVSGGSLSEPLLALLKGLLG